MRYLVILMMLVGCSTSKQVPIQYVSLPPFPESHTDYRYFIRIPISTTSVTIYWYDGIELGSRIIYSSGYVPVRTSVVETDMYFPLPGKYILIYYCQTSNGVKKYKQTYNVRLNELYESITLQ
jgi:hypothetical protein